MTRTVRLPDGTEARGQAVGFICDGGVGSNEL